MLTPLVYLNNSRERLAAIVVMLKRKEKGERVEIKEDIMFSNIGDSILDICAGLELVDFYAKDYLERSFASILPMIRNQIRTSHIEYGKLREDETRDPVEYIQILEQMIDAITPVVENASLSCCCSAWYFSVEDFSTQWLENPKYSLPENILEEISRRISNKKECNILDLNAKDFSALQALGGFMPMAKLYGVTGSYISMSQDKRALFERIVTADPLEAVKISNDCFDIVIATPKLTFFQERKAVNFVPDERMTLNRATRYLRKGGLLIYPIPRMFLSKNIVAFLSKNFKNIQVIEDTFSTHGGNHHVVVILGTKASALERVLDPDVYTVLRNMVSGSTSASDLEGREYTLPNGLLQVTRFRSNKLDDAEAETMFRESTAMRDFWESQSVAKISDRKARPLLPFNVGQLGLVLTSGCLDGIVDEGNNCGHVVKGRVIKVKEVSHDIDEEKMKRTEHETTSNRVEINVFLPDGTYKCLA